MPIGVALVINIVLFGVVGMALHRNAVLRRSHRNTGGSREQVRELRGLMCVFVILGLVWIFGVLINTANGTASLALQYLFAITATLQGVGIFFFNVYLNTNARAEMSKSLSSTAVSSLHSGKSGPNRSSRKGTKKFVPRSDGRLPSSKSETMKKNPIYHPSDSDHYHASVNTNLSVYEASRNDAATYMDVSAQTWVSKFNDCNTLFPSDSLESGLPQPNEGGSPTVWESPLDLLSELGQQLDSQGGPRADSFQAPSSLFASLLGTLPLPGTLEPVYHLGQTPGAVDDLS